MLRIGDMLDPWHQTDIVLICGRPASPTDPWPSVSFLLDIPDAAFANEWPADFGERDFEQGLIYGAADAWSTWTE